MCNGIAAANGKNKIRQHNFSAVPSREDKPFSPAEHAANHVAIGNRSLRRRPPHPYRPDPGMQMISPKGTLSLTHLEIP